MDVLQRCCGSARAVGHHCDLADRRPVASRFCTGGRSRGCLAPRIDAFAGRRRLRRSAPPTLRWPSLGGRLSSTRCLVPVSSDSTRVAPSGHADVRRRGTASRTFATTSPTSSRRPCSLNHLNAFRLSPLCLRTGCLTEELRETGLIFLWHICTRVCEIGGSERGVRRPAVLRPGDLGPRR